MIGIIVSFMIGGFVALYLDYRTVGYSTDSNRWADRWVDARGALTDLVHNTWFVATRGRW